MTFSREKRVELAEELVREAVGHRNDAGEVDMRHFQHGNLPEGFRQMLIDVHADAYADQMDDPFHQRFAWFVDHWTGMDGFSCVVAYDNDEPVGFAYGAPLAPGREWWRSTAGTVGPK
jgi:hypothetical protein